MAKIKNSVRVNLKNVSIDKLTSIGATEIKGYDRDNLARIVTKLNSAANKRLARLEKEGYSTPAMRSAKVNRGERFSVKGKNLKQLRGEYIRVSNFLKAETSTVKGYKKFLKRMKKAFNEQGVKIGGGSAKEAQDFIDLETGEWLPNINLKTHKYEAMKQISDMVDQGNLSELAIKRRMNKWAKKVYEEEQRKNSVDTSDFFDVTEDEE